MYRGSLSIVVYEKFSDEAMGAILQRMEDGGKLNLLITDGIMLSPDFLERLRQGNVEIQRLLTSHQFIRIMGEQDMGFCVAVLNSKVVSDWNSSSVNFMLDAMVVWPMSRGLNAMVQFIGLPPLKIRTNHVMKRAYYRMDTGGDKEWGETRLPQGRLWKFLCRE